VLEKNLAENLKSKAENSKNKAEIQKIKLIIQKTKENMSKIPKTELLQKISHVHKKKLKK
jgi:hypothetical protein